MIVDCSDPELAAAIWQLLTPPVLAADEVGGVREEQSRRPGSISKEAGVGV